MMASKNFIRAIQKIKAEHRWLIIALCGLIFSMTVILLSFYFSPNFIAKHLSPDGILEQRYISDINILRIALYIVGIFFAVLFLFFLLKPYYFKLFFSRLDLRTTYLSISLWFFSIITLIFGFPQVITSTADFQSKIEKRDAHTLRLEFHRWYRNEHAIMEFIKKHLSNDKLLLINGKHEHFFAYYLAPRPVYKYSEILTKELTRAGRNYYIIDTIWDEKNNIIRWSISEGPDGNIIIQKIEKSSR